MKSVLSTDESKAGESNGGGSKDGERKLKEKMPRASEIPCVWYSKGMSFGGTAYPRQFFQNKCVETFIVKPFWLL